MGGLGDWPQLDDLCQRVRQRPGIELWLFGSALTANSSPADLDVLLIYEHLGDVAAIRAAHPWEEETPPVHIIAMTAQEESEYKFIQVTSAQRLV